MAAKKAQRGMVRDARRRRVPVVSLRNLAQADADADGRRHELVQEIKDRTKQAAYSIASANVLWLFAVAIVWKILEERVLPRHAFQGLPILAAIVGLFSLFSGICWLSASRASRLRRARMAVKAGFCGSCGYDLSGLEQAHDGNIVCPECGSAWQAYSEPLDQAVKE